MRPVGFAEGYAENDPDWCEVMARVLSIPNSSPAKVEEQFTDWTRKRDSMDVGLAVYMSAYRLGMERASLELSYRGEREGVLCDAASVGGTVW